MEETNEAQFSVRSGSRGDPVLFPRFCPARSRPRRSRGDGKRERKQRFEPRQRRKQRRRKWQVHEPVATQNTKLSEKIASLTGESAQQACDGFKNLGQCVAAAHVSKNLDISFTCLKSEMTGTAPSSSTSGCPAATSGKSMSLGQAISTLSPKVNNKTEAKKGEQQAKQDLRDTTNNS